MSRFVICQVQCRIACRKLRRAWYLYQPSHHSAFGKPCPNDEAGRVGPGQLVRTSEGGPSSAAFHSTSFQSLQQVLLCRQLRQDRLTTRHISENSMKMPSMRSFGACPSQIISIPPTLTVFLTRYDLEVNDIISLRSLANVNDPPCLHEVTVEVHTYLMYCNN